MSSICACSKQAVYRQLSVSALQFDGNVSVSLHNVRTMTIPMMRNKDNNMPDLCECRSTRDEMSVYSHAIYLHLVCMHLHAMRA